MRRLLAMCSILLLLSACGGQAPAIWTPSPTAPAPAPSATPQGSEAPWASITPEQLPTVQADLESLSLLSSPQIFLLGTAPEDDVALYGLNPGYGGGVLLRRGEHLTHFDQVFSPAETPALPELYQLDLDGDGQSELAVRYLASAQAERIVYDLHIYDWDGETWTDCAATGARCAALALRQLTVDYDESSGLLTLSYGLTSATYQVPAQHQGDPGALALDSAFFRSSDGRFTVVLGARAQATGTCFANVLADLEYSDGSFALRNIRIEPTTVV